jgi:hypothetical protein
MKLVKVFYEGMVVDVDYYSINKLVEMSNKGIIWETIANK